ncbi:MAG: Eco57I restriction-modification methylase domain-containing protein [Boseongicola sp.]|nr:Eco57I restriction-modification methylase domain-containing protein [Boseongicola sp.]
MEALAPRIDIAQPSLPDMCAVTQAVNAMARSGVEQRGAIFTRREVVDFIFDLVGYTADRRLHELRLMEPSFGAGDFLVPAVERLIASWQADESFNPVSNLSDAIRAVELHEDSYRATSGKLTRLLEQAGMTSAEAQKIISKWLIFGDFLLAPIDGSFDVIVGNPPYVRQELIPNSLMAEYRTRYRTIYDRADIYIPFIERCLTSLKSGGQLGFICADRWMKNRYGRPLRELIARDFHLKIFVDMVDTPAFHKEVVAYPAITIIARSTPGETQIARRPQITRDSLSALAAQLTGLTHASTRIDALPHVAASGEPWVLDVSDELAIIRQIEDRFPTLEQAGCKVGIGVATGADKAFIGPHDELDVEADRKLPIAMTRDIKDGSVVWRGFGVVNPFGDDGKLVDLAAYPRLRRYLEARKDQIAKRHVATKAPANWYRTIDRIYPELARRPKLLIPDIKGEALIVNEEGWLYPHHNLYFIISDEWDLHALQAVLQSGIARAFVATYSTRMRGGYLRFQAQYLRRIRIPLWSDVPKALRQTLIASAFSGDRSSCSDAVASLYGLSASEMTTLRAC